MKKVLLVIALSTVLTACGSSSGGSSHSGGIDNNGGKNITPTIPNKDGNKNLVLNDVTKSDMNKLVLDGKTIELVPSFMRSKGFYRIQDRTSARAISGNKYKETRFGILVPDYNAKPVAISQGNVTSINDMPTQDIVVTYLGDFVGYNKDKKSFEEGEVKVDINFALKDMTINAFKNNERLGFMKGKVVGNQFTFGSEKGQGKGQFYGSQAAELSGYHEGKHSVISFGAKKK